MDLNFNDLIDILDGEEFDEKPVDLRVFVICQITIRSKKILEFLEMGSWNF